MMRRRRPRQLPIPFDRDADVPAIALPAPTAQHLVEALADLLLVTVLGEDADEERDDAHEDHR
jgi:hypothetical protein